MKLYLIGSTPLLLSGLGQYFFNWHGPINILNGLIIWFQRPLGSDEGITGLFNNPNYMGCWLTIIFPFSIFILKTCRKNYQKISINIIILVILLIALLTYSRSCWATIILTFPILFGRKILFWFLPLITFTFIGLFLASNQWIPENIQLEVRNIIPDNIWLQFSDIGFSNIDSSRLEILRNSLILIKENLIFGWGGGTFPQIINEKTGFWFGHTHNLFIELAFNYGIIPALILVVSFILLFLKSYSKKFSYELNLSNKLNYLVFSNKIWWTSTLLLLLTQMVDVQYYDFRISVSLWILITGLKCIIKENKNLINNI